MLNRKGEVRVALSLATFLTVAVVLRIPGLTVLPPAHYRDVAITASDALRAASGHPCLHYTYDEGLYANLLGVVFRVLGPSDWAVRAPGALFGVLTCFAVYLLGRSLGAPRAGLYGAGILAVNLWHVILSRSGFRAVLLPLLLSVSFALLVGSLRRVAAGGGQDSGVDGGGGGGVRSGPASVAMVAGGLFGLGVHVYPAVRFAPFILPPLLLAELGFDRGTWRRARRILLLYAAAALVVALPMLLHYLHHPEHFTFPRRVLSVFSPKFDRQLILPELGKNLVATLLMFHVRGDANWRHNLSGAPMLDPLAGLVLLVGIVSVLRRRSDRRPAVLLLVWLPVMLLPNLLSVEGVPHGLRSSGALPALALLCGFGLEEAERRLARAAGERAAVAAVAGAILLTALWTGYRHASVWGGAPEAWAAHDGAYRAAARLLLSAPPGTEVSLITNGKGLRSRDLPAEVWCYLWEMRGRPPVLIGPKDGPRLRLAGRPGLVAFVYRDEAILEAIRRLNPGSPVVEISAPGLSPDSPVYRIN